jgi:excisionase family DNA binding protein
MVFGPKRMDRDLTTGEVARLTELSQQTIIRSCDRGSLPSYKLPPDRRHRRIRRLDLVAWAADHGIPLKPFSLVDPKPRK